MSKRYNSKRKKKKTNLILLILILMGMGCLIYGLYLNSNTKRAEYAPVDIDENAIKEDTDKKKLEVSEGGGAVSLSYSNEVTVDLAKNEADLYFKNPGESREDITLELIIKENGNEIVIAKSELIPTGHAIYKLKLNENINIERKNYDGIYRTTYYNEETGAKEMVNSELELSIKVK